MGTPARAALAALVDPMELSHTVAPLGTSLGDMMSVTARVDNFVRANVKMVVGTASSCRLNRLPLLEVVRRMTN